MNNKPLQAIVLKADNSLEKNKIIDSYYNRDDINVVKITSERNDVDNTHLIYIKYYYNNINYTKYKIVVINGSERSNDISETYKAIKIVLDELKFNSCGKYTNDDILIYDIPHDFNGCLHCEKSNDRKHKYCKFNSQQDDDIITHIKNAEIVLFASPVYLDTPTGKMLNFLHRLSCVSEYSRRRIFNKIHAYTLAVGYCSGTKTVCHTLFGALEMLGFNIPPRSSRERILLWKDERIRGGL